MPERKRPRRHRPASPFRSPRKDGPKQYHRPETNEQSRRLSGAERRPHVPEQPARDWIYGAHAALAALANPRRECRRLVVTAAARERIGPRLSAIIATRPGLNPETVDRRSLDTLFPGAVHQGIAVAVAPLPDVAIEDICRASADDATSRVVVLDQATDPHNVGAVLRAAAAFGARAVMVQDRHAPDATATLLKAASGAIETTPLVRVVNLARALRALKDAGFWCVGLDAGASTSLGDCDLSGRVALILGAEGAGLRRLSRETCDTLARIPIAPPSGSSVDSLNVATAAAIALYEASRRRT